jgi:predicted PurR-regulated permease PerM|tara:strand:+ start:120 stop:257 length:138 start_codon:yes stop_codon:yes gene_type:complete
MDAIMAIGMILGGFFGILLGFYLVLCFIQWISDIIEEGDWRYWFK